MKYRDLITIFVGIIFFLAFTGRLHWLVAIFAGLVPLAGRLMSLLRFLPFLKAAQSFFASRSTLSSSGRPNASKVRSRFLEMELNHGNGAVVGEVIEGQFKGTLLNNLDIEQLKRLWLECQLGMSFCMKKTNLDSGNNGAQFHVWKRVEQIKLSVWWYFIAGQHRN